ncbi:hypothetical protein D3C86_928400 [compost metagenome]
MVPSIDFGFLCLASMMSISPVKGQLAVPAGSIQKAGHAPIPEDNFIRASTLPYLTAYFPSVVSFAEE